MSFEGGGCCRQPDASSPIIFDLEGNGVSLSNHAGGVSFDLNFDGTPQPLSWTIEGSDDSWLALDRNGSGTIDNGGELFGNYTQQPEPPAGVLRNGFLALAQFDKIANGGNADRIIDHRDSIFRSLLLWQDANHNGISEQAELKSLFHSGVKSIDLDFKMSKRVDQYGNRFRYRAQVKDVNDAHIGRWAWDVFLLTTP